MGMYTEIFVSVDLRSDVPEDVIAVLKAICGGEDKTPLQGKPERWARLFSSGSFYTPNTSCAILNYDETGKLWSLLGKGDVKNYGGEIEAFFEWLMPYVAADPGAFIGYKRHEDSLVPELVYLS